MNKIISLPAELPAAGQAVAILRLAMHSRELEPDIPFTLMKLESLKYRSKTCTHHARLYFDPTSWVVSSNRLLCLPLQGFFVFFKFLVKRRSQRWTDCGDLYVKRRRFAQGHNTDKMQRVIAL